MTARNDFSIEGLDELIKAFARLGDEAMPKLKSASDTAGQIVLEKTKSKVNVDTGELKAALYLKTKRLRNGDTYTDCRVTFPRSVSYAVPLELGHGLVFFGRRTMRYIQPRPFLRPAADESKELVIDLISNAMNEAIEEMGGKR